MIGTTFKMGSGFVAVDIMDAELVNFIKRLAEQAGVDVDRTAEWLGGVVSDARGDERQCTRRILDIDHVDNDRPFSECGIRTVLNAGHGLCRLYREIAECE